MSWLVIATENDGGVVRGVDSFPDFETALRFALAGAEADGYFERCPGPTPDDVPQVTRAELEKQLRQTHSYSDGDVLTTLWELQP